MTDRTKWEDRHFCKDKILRKDSKDMKMSQTKQKDIDKRLSFGNPVSESSFRISIELRNVVCKSH